MTDIVVFGAGGHARVVADVIRLSSQFNLRGFLDDADPDRHGASFEGSQIIGGREKLAELWSSGVTHAIVAVGDNGARQRIGEELLQAGFALPTLVHPAAVVAAGVTIGPGTVVFAGAIINPATLIGTHVIINTGATIDHDCVIANAVHIAPGAHLAGNVSVGEGALIGVGAAIKPGVTIGRDAIVGVGAAVIDDVEPGRAVGGVPARVIK